MIEVNVEANKETWWVPQGSSSDGHLLDSDRQPETGNARSNATALDYRPGFVFHNNVRGRSADCFQGWWISKDYREQRAGSITDVTQVTAISYRQHNHQI
ncbi:hypothetical protein BJX76DRAFT_60941 [Aspergillus varians]